MENDNLLLWKSVEKTNPKYTKKANVRGNQITSISPQFQILSATEKFGIYGAKWGFKNVDIDFTLKEIGMVCFKAVFYFPGGEFEIINSIGLYKDGAMSKIDSDFAKKLETDTLTKALSKLGFNADIFLGKFDDLRYVEEVNEEFKAQNNGLITDSQHSEIRVKLQNAGIDYQSACMDWGLKNFGELLSINFSKIDEYINSVKK